MKHSSSENSWNLKPKSDAAYERDVKAMELFIFEIHKQGVTSASDEFQLSRDDRDTASKQRDLHEKLLKLPPRFTFKSVYLYGRSEEGKFNLMLQLNLNSEDMNMLWLFSLPQVDSFLEIFIACGCCARAVGYTGQFSQSTAVPQSTDLPQSTAALLRRLQDANKHAEKPSAKEITLANMRSKLPMPVTDEVLRNTRLPSTMCKELILEDLLNDVMRHIENMK